MEFQFSKHNQHPYFTCSCIQQMSLWTSPSPTAPEILRAIPLLTNVFSSSSCWQGPSGPISGRLRLSLHTQHLTDSGLEGFSPISSMRIFLIPLATSGCFKCKQKRLSETQLFCPQGTSQCPLLLGEKLRERRKSHGS